MQKKTKVAVLYGGPSAEHEVSLQTGKNVIAALNKEKYAALPVSISKNGEWFLCGRQVSPCDALKKADVVFNAMHGEYGEDGTVQGFLDAIGARYTGAGQKASMIGIDKALTKHFCAERGILTPDFCVVRRGNSFKSARMKYPVVVKPNARGSSVGVSIVRSEKTLRVALKEAFCHDDGAMIEQFIRGREITVGVLENFRGKKYFPLAPTEIIPGKEHEFFDYKAKYTAGATREITPAPLPKHIIKKAQEIAVAVFSAVGARHYSRIDMIIDKNRNIYTIEINTLPGLTATSLLPQQAAHAGLSLEKLINHLLQLALTREGQAQ